MPIRLKTTTSHSETEGASAPTSTDLVLATDSPLPDVSEMPLDALKAEAVNLKLSIDKGENVLREWRIRLGQVLEEIKERLGHGKWLPYVKDTLELEHAQVSNYMKLAESSNAVRNLPVGLSMREELAALRQSRGPRPLTEASTDVEAPGRALVRFCGPDWSTASIVKAIVLTSFPDASTCLDVTYGSGNFWSEGAPLPVVCRDLDPERALDGVMDFTDIQYDDATFDLVVFDPPHLADGGDESVMAGKFGTVASQDALEELIEGGVREAWRVCLKGIVVKITDHVHGQTFHDMGLVVCDAVGAWPYEKVHQVRGHAFVDPSWGEQCSAYNNGSTYLIFRKGDQRHIPRRPSNGSATRGSNAPGQSSG